MANVTPAEELDAALGLELHRGMWRIRAFEERVGQLTRADEVHGLVHLSVGQEAVAVGVCGQLSSDDGVYGNHRAHGHAIAKGAPVERVGAPFAPVPFSPPLEDGYVPGRRDVAAAVRALFGLGSGALSPLSDEFKVART